MDTRTSPLALLADPYLLRTASLIGNRWVHSPDHFDVVDPATSMTLARVANASPHDAEEAIVAAAQALTLWRQLTAGERAALLHRWHRLIVDHTDDLARIMTAEQGKPFAEAQLEVGYAASFVDWFAEEGRRIYGEVITPTHASRRMLVFKQPIGVCAAITPWNFPLGMITRKVAPALAAGCTVIIKPAEQTPLTALAVAELARRAGIPAGVINVLSADSANSIAIGKVLTDSAVVRHISFTGSTEVGRILMRQCAATIKKLSLELGGNAPFVVFDDADLESAVEGALVAKYRNAGQVCVAANRFFVQQGIHDRFVARLAERSTQMKVGNGFEAGVRIGPLIEPEAIDKVEQHIADARTQGARVVAGGRRIAGQFFEPTVLADVTTDMLCAREETFGPVASVIRFVDEADVIRMANDTIYGLAAYFYSRDVGRVWRVAEALECGMVGVNTGMVSAAEAPFGGVKQSGLGREGSHQGIDEYVETKLVVMGDIA